MRKILAIAILIVAAILVGCESRGDEPAEMPIETPADAMESIAGVWRWPPDNGGNPIYVGADGTWNHVLGDAEVRGNAQLTQDGNNFTVEFIALEIIGPGAIFDSYGNFRGEGFNPETNEYYWIPVLYPIEVWFSAVYYIYYDRLVILDSLNDLEFEMERTR